MSWFNERNYKKTGKYELVCGEGRLKAFQLSSKTYIDAEIINVDESKALLMGLAENLTRTKKDIMEFARRIVKMHDQGKGISYDDLASNTGNSVHYTFLSGMRAVPGTIVFPKTARL